MYFQSCTIEIDNFAFEVKFIQGLESTIPDGRTAGRLACQPDGQTDGRRSWEQNQHSLAGAWAWAELGKIHISIETSDKQCHTGPG